MELQYPFIGHYIPGSADLYGLLTIPSMLPDNWKLFWWSLLRRPKMFPMAITYAIYGYHFRKVYKIG